MGKLEAKIPLGRPRCRLEDGININVQEVGKSVKWIVLAQDRVKLRALVNTVMTLRVP